MAQYSLLPETREAIISKHQTSVYKLTDGEMKSVQSKFAKMTAGLWQYKLAKGRRVRKSKTAIRKIRQLSKLTVEYPPELVAARRAAFVLQVRQKCHSDRVSGN